MPHLNKKEKTRIRREARYIFISVLALLLTLIIVYENIQIQ